MRTRITLPCLIVAAGLLFPHDASGQRIQSPYRFMGTKQALTPFAGYLATGKGSLDLGPASGTIFGMRYSIAISGPFALEAALSYFSQTRAVHDTIPGDTMRATIGEADFRTLLATAGLRFNLTGPRTWHGVQPYVSFGLGVGFDFTDPAEVEADLPADLRFDFGTSFMGLLGGGADLTLSERWALSLDARNLLWKLKTPTAFLQQGEQARLLPGDEWAQNLSLSAGLVFRF